MLLSQLAGGLRCLESRKLLLLLQVLVPYLRAKLESWVVRQGGQTGGAAAGLGLGLQSSDSSDEEDGDALRDEDDVHPMERVGRTRRRRPMHLLGRLKKAFVRSWPYINGGYEFTMLVYQFLYVRSSSRVTHASPA
eukprot:SAG31_NODE_4607_length_3098_cov_4.930310_2_plen_136_part_00